MCRVVVGGDALEEEEAVFELEGDEDMLHDVAGDVTSSGTSCASILI